MAIGNCDCCDRRAVPGFAPNGTYCGDVTACFLCQGDVDPDPYSETEIEVPCPECRGDGGFESVPGGRWCGCHACEGTGSVFEQPELVTLEDLENQQQEEAN